MKENVERDRTKTGVCYELGFARIKSPNEDERVAYQGKAAKSTIPRGAVGGR